MYLKWTRTPQKRKRIQKLFISMRKKESEAKDSKKQQTIRRTAVKGKEMDV